MEQLCLSTCPLAERPKCNCLLLVFINPKCNETAVWGRRFERFDEIGVSNQTTL